MKISDCVSSLTSTWNEWRTVDFLLNPRYVRNGNTITWNNYSPKHLSDPISSKDVLDLIDGGQYSFQIGIDGSIVQMYYVFIGDYLASASLGYFNIGMENADTVGWIRLDYDPRSDKGILHPQCHLHIGNINNSRIMVNGFPSPAQFIEFIALSFYPSAYESLRIENGNVKDKQRIETLNLSTFEKNRQGLNRLFAHLQIPPS